MNKLDYRCKICGKPGVAEYDPDCPIQDLEKWRSMLTCNRCGDFRAGFIRLRDNIARTCSIVYRSRMVKEGAELVEIENNARQRLEALTKNLCRLVCGHWGVTNIWDTEFVSTLMEQPRSSMQAVDFYARSIRKESVGKTSNLPYADT